MAIDRQMDQRLGGRLAKALENFGIFVDFEEICLFKIALLVAARGYAKPEGFSRQKRAKVSARAENPAAPVKFAPGLGEIKGWSR